MNLLFLIYLYLNIYVNNKEQDWFVFYLTSLLTVLLVSKYFKHNKLSKETKLLNVAFLQNINYFSICLELYLNLILFDYILDSEIEKMLIPIKIWSNELLSYI